MAAETLEASARDEKFIKEAPQLAAVLREMKEGLEAVTKKVHSLTMKVKAKQYPTADGITYLEAKHLLLLNYCQSLVYYLLRKARGLPIEKHPVVHSLLEIRLFLEKIRPIDKKLEYQLQKLTRAAANGVHTIQADGKEISAQKSEDLLKYRPKPDMLIPELDLADEKNDRGVYRPPKIAPTTLDEGKIAREERNARRKAEDMVRRARASEFARNMINDLEDQPEEVRETIGTESKELASFRQKWEERDHREEELFNRNPITKAEKKKMKHLLKSRNGLMGLTESFYDEIKSLAWGDDAGEQTSVGAGSGSNMERRHKKRKKR